MNEVKTRTLHAFVDASSEAYGAAVYLKCEYKDGTVSVQLITSKTKVALLSFQSIPRLELMEAVLGMRLAISVARVLQLEKNLVTFWSDSMDVLWWIRGRSQCFKPFIANQIGEIQALSEPKQWRHVRTVMNPADLPTRGMSIKDLKKSTLWWDGPGFLKHSEEVWPETEIEANLQATKEVRMSHVKKNSADRVILLAIGPESWRLHPERFSSWLRLTRVHAWVNCFIENCRAPLMARSDGELKAQEICNAEFKIVQETQESTFAVEYKALMNQKPIPSNCKLLSIKLMLDEYGVMRSDGRLMHTDYLLYDVRYPIILPRRHWVTKLIVRAHHEKGNHQAGTNQTLSTLATRYWILQAREEIRDCEKECYGGQRHKASPGNQIMAPLPRTRFKLPLREFARVAVDYAGPFVTIQGHGKQRAKRYLCLFTCLASVHLEMSYSMDTDAFLNAFFQMVNCRGLPAEVVSNSGSNFIGGE